MEQSNILIVSGKKTDQLVLSSCLERAHPRRFHVSAVDNCQRPLDVLMDPDVHIVIVAKGSETEYLLRLAKKNDVATPIIVLLDDIDNDTIARLRELGAQDYLIRGQLQDELVHRIVDFAAQLRAAREQIQRLSNRDSLTGALNRLGFRAHLERAMARSKRYQFKTGLLYLNLDRFQLINDYYGENGGDLTITTVAQRLRAKLRGTDSLARLGGDEFVTVLEDVGSWENVDAIAHKMLESLAIPLMIDDQQVCIEASMGGALYPDDASDFSELVDNCRSAMQLAKTQKGSHYQRYSQQSAPTVKDNSSLEEELRAAVHQNEFLLYFQPRIDLKNQGVVGLEALIRWQHPQRGILLPASFLPECEEYGLMRHIGYQVIAHACAALTWLDEQGLSHIDVAVNVSFTQCQDEQFVETVTNIIKRAGIDASRLEFELTESTILKSAGSLKGPMDELRALGISFSLDDFGTGFSQLSHIMDLPISALKIDACFVQDLPDNKQQEAVCTMIIDMARRLGLMVVAEGAETQEQIDFLQKNHCEQVQGLYYSAAIPLEQLPLVIQRQHARYRESGHL